MQTKGAVNRYLDSCLAANLSEKTVMAYEKVLSHFANHCPILPTEPEPIESFMASHRKQWADQTQHLCYRILRAFYNWAEVRYQEPNPMELIKAPRCKRKEIQTLDIAEQVMVASVGENDRDRAILTLLLDSMIRRGELASLRRDDVQGNTIKVQGKTGERIVPISEVTARLLSRIGRGPYLFIGQRGEPLGVQGISGVVKKYLLKLGIKGDRLGPHLLRHTAATQFIENGGNPLVLQQVYLGHSTLTMTSHYVHLAMTSVAARQHEQFSPLQSAMREVSRKND